jgi:predicted HTH domain antitoxin
MLASPVSVQIPPDLLQFGINRHNIQRRVTEWLIVSLFVEGQISSGKAAKLLDMPRVDFLAFLKAHGIAYLHYDADELHEEFEAVEQLDVERMP